MHHSHYILLSAALCSSEIIAQEGQLDLSFGVNGMAVLSLDTLVLSLSDMAVQDDGKIVSTGRCLTGEGWDMYVIRCLPDGELDPTFGNMGSVRTDLGTYWDRGFAVTFQQDGKILVAGESSANTFESTVTLVRYLPDGSLDETFGSSGVATASPNAYGHPFDLAVKDSGEILLVGSSAYYDAITLYQFTASGMPDSTFQSDGTMSIAPFWSTNMATDVLIQDDGKIVLACVSDAGGDLDVAVIRLLSDGSYDMTFGIGGIKALSVSPGDDTAGGLGLQSDGSIVLVGTTRHYPNYDMFAARFTPSGALDLEFGTDGIAVVSTSIGSDAANGLVIQPDDALILAGRSGHTGGAGAVAVVRLTPDGSLDPVFGNAGIVVTPGTSSPAGYAVDLQPDGRIIVAAGGGGLPVLLRYWAGAFSGLDENPGVRDGFAAFPNPASDVVTITFELNSPAMVSLEMMDGAGRVVLPRVHDRPLPAGPHRVELDLGQLASGVHVIKLSTGRQLRTLKLMKK